MSEPAQNVKAMLFLTKTMFQHFKLFFEWPILAVSV